MGRKVSNNIVNAIHVVHLINYIHFEVPNIGYTNYMNLFLNLKYAVWSRVDAITPSPLLLHKFQSFLLMVLT